MLKFITRIAHNNLVYRRERHRISCPRINELIPNAVTVLDVGAVTVASPVSCKVEDTTYTSKDLMSSYATRPTFLSAGSTVVRFNATIKASTS